MKDPVLRAIVVCVDYADMLALTLPANRHHFAEYWVVTAPRDQATIDVALANDARVLETDVFWARGAEFNKWAALEAGLDAMGRHGWMCTMDADIVWPRQAKYVMHCGQLYSAPRRICDPIPSALPDESDWTEYPYSNELPNHWSGYLHIFHCDDPRAKYLPWYGRDWRHAGAADTLFQRRWPLERRAWLKFHVLHLGPAMANWCGRVTPYQDGTLPLNAKQNTERMSHYLNQRAQARDRNFGDERL